jgi:CCR4-NOT transcription complex subunit 1
MQAIDMLSRKGGQQPVMHAPAVDIYQRLAVDLDTEGRYLFLNALANQLRFPNNHTHYFSCVLLYLFAEAQQVWWCSSRLPRRTWPRHCLVFVSQVSCSFWHAQEIIQEQITRVLLERLIVNRPHPWGLLITFIELIKNPRYNFWQLSFTHCAAEIERLFESVAKSCMGQARPGEADDHQQQPSMQLQQQAVGA